MAQNFRIALIGGGNMGGALAAGWLRTKRGPVAAEELLIIDPHPGEAVQDQKGNSGTEDIYVQPDPVTSQLHFNANDFRWLG